MAGQYNRWERFYNKVNLWFNGMVAVSIIPFGLAFLDTQSEFPSPPLVGEDVTLILQVSFALVVALLIGFGVYLSKNQLGKLDANSLEGKLKGYLAIKKRSFFILECGAVLSVLGLYLTKDQLFTGFYLVVMFVFSLSKPTFEKIASDIRSSEQALADWGQHE